MKRKPQYLVRLARRELLEKVVGIVERLSDLYADIEASQSRILAQHAQILQRIEFIEEKMDDATPPQA